MKPLVISAAAAFFGALLGFAGATWFASARLGPWAARKTTESLQVRAPIRTTELVLEDPQGRSAARLTTVNGRTVLTFLGNENEPAIEIGVDQNHSARFVRFFSEEGKMTTALNSAPPHGASTLYLGDDIWTTRITLGASRAPEVESWGLRIGVPGSLFPVFHVLSKNPEKSEAWSAGMRMVRPDGQVWAP
jgi:hypothetical protein